MLDDGDGDRPDGPERLDPVELDPATDRDARDARLGGPPRDAQRGLAEAGLGVDPALAGDDEVGAGQPGAKSVASITSSTPGRSANDRKRPAIASSANPTPPAAPAPGVSRTRAPAADSSASAQAASRRSSSATSSGDAPFCGP